VSQEESEHNEVDGMKKGVDSKGEVMHIDHLKERLIYEWCHFDQRIIDRAVGQW